MSPRSAHRRRSPEAQLQRSLVEHLRWRAPLDCWFCHIPNGGARTATEGAIFKSLGTRAGAPDIVIVTAGRPLFIECKAPGRKLSQAQIECHAALERAGAIVRTFDDIDAALGFLAKLGVLR